MKTPAPLSAFMIGETTLLLHCAQRWLARGNRLLAICSPNPDLLRWAANQGIAALDDLPRLRRQMREQTGDFLFSIVNGHLLDDDTIALARRGAINFHDSLLPRYAGLNATSWAIMQGQSRHGITWHRIGKGIDDGDILLQREVAIDPRERVASLDLKCFEAATQSFGELIAGLASGDLAGRPQDKRQRSYLSRSAKSSGACLIDWRQSSQQIDALLRALDFDPFDNPVGVPRLPLAGDYLRISRHETADAASDAAPGTLLAIDDDGLLLATGDGALRITGLSDLLGNEMTATALSHRYNLRPGERLPLLPPDLRQRITDLDAALARHEPFWVAQLAQSRPIPPPYLDPRDRLSYQQSQPRRLRLDRDPSAPSSDGVPAAEREAMWLFTLACFTTYLARVQQRDSFDLGYHDSRQQRPWSEQAGLFAHYLPLPVHFQGDLDITALGRRLRDQLQRIERHRTHTLDLPLRYARLRGRDELRDHDFFPVVAARIDCVDAYIEQHRPALALILGEQDENCSLAYDAARIEPALAQRMAAQLTTLAAAAHRDPGCTLARLPLLATAEYRRVLHDLNQTDLPLPDDACVHRWFERQAERTPRALAVQQGEQRLSFAELDRQASQTAAYLRARGIGEQAIVGLCMDRCCELIVALLGILKAGAAYLPLDPNYPAARLQFMQQDSRAAVIVSLTRLRPLLPFSDHVLLLLDQHAAQIARCASDSPSAGGGDTLAYLLYTSGSTGEPKGVMVEHRSLCNYVRAANRFHRFTASDRLLQFSSIAFDASLEDIFCCLTSGACLVLRDEDTLRSIPRFLQRCRDWQITVLNLPTAYWHRLTDALSAQRQPFPQSVRLLIIGGEAAQNRHLRLWCEMFGERPELCNEYGPTEATVAASFYRLPADCASAAAGGSMPIGMPIDNTHLLVLDANLQPVPMGLPGELYIAGYGIARGYLNRPELTAERFIANPFDGRHNRLYRTGDRVRYLPDGNLEYLGRIDNQVKVRGFRVEPGEIEIALARHPQIRQALVVDYPGAAGGQQLAAYLVGADQPPDERQLRAFLRAQLPEYMVPAVFLSLPEFPLTGNGKIDRQALPDPRAASASQASAANGSLNATEIMLREIWSQELGLATLDPDADFFALGGDSLSAIGLFSRIEQMTGKALPLDSLLKAPTLRGMALLLGEHNETARCWQALIPIQPEGNLPPLFFVPSGTVLSLHALSRCLGPEQPLYGLQPYRGDGQPLHSQVEAIAQGYLREVLSLQPQGPYYLAGDCLGGIIAFQLAREIHLAGQQVAFLGLSDPPVPGLPKPEATPGFVRQLHRENLDIIKHGPMHALTYIGRKLAARYRRYRRHRRQRLQGQAPGANTLYLRPSDIYFEAARQFAPQPYPGHATLFLPHPLNWSVERQYRYWYGAGYETLWAPLLSDGMTRVETIADHDDLLEPGYVEDYADKLRACLQQARRHKLERAPEPGADATG